LCDQFLSESVTNLTQRKVWSNKLFIPHQLIDNDPTPKRIDSGVCVIAFLLQLLDKKIFSKEINTFTNIRIHLFNELESMRKFHCTPIQIDDLSMMSEIPIEYRDWFIKDVRRPYYLTFIFYLPELDLTHLT
jgi:hypothetical protein